MGILGIDVLEHYCIQLDFAAGKMRFLDDQHADKSAWGKAFPIVPLNEQDPRPAVAENLFGRARHRIRSLTAVLSVMAGSCRKISSHGPTTRFRRPTGNCAGPTACLAAKNIPCFPWARRTSSPMASGLIFWRVIWSRSIFPITRSISSANPSVCGPIRRLAEYKPIPDQEPERHRPPARRAAGPDGRHRASR